MGTYVEGELEVEFSRELTEDEHGAWEHNVRAGRPEAPPCGNLAHKGAPMIEVDGVLRCEHYNPTPNTGGYCYSDSDRYDPQGWDFTGDIWGDIGVAELSRTGFTIRSGGKVYDITDAVAYFVEALPPDVTAEGSGYFTSDSEPWGLRVAGREVREVASTTVVEGDPAPRGTTAWMVGHVNFTDGTIASQVFAAERDARIAYTDELREHLHEDGDHTNIAERVGDVPWVAHFVADGECLTYLDRVTVS
jgi:hypothetical protein